MDSANHSQKPLLQPPSSQYLQSLSVVQVLGQVPSLLGATSVVVAEIGDEANATTMAKTIAENRMIGDSDDMIWSVNSEEDRKMTGFYALDIIVWNCYCMVVFEQSQQIHQWTDEHIKIPDSTE